MKLHATLNYLSTPTVCISFTSPSNLLESHGCYWWYFIEKLFPSLLWVLYITPPPHTTKSLKRVWRTIQSYILVASCFEKSYLLSRKCKYLISILFPMSINTCSQNFTSLNLSCKRYHLFFFFLKSRIVFVIIYSSLYKINKNNNWEIGESE